MEAAFVDDPMMFLIRCPRDSPSPSIEEYRFQGVEDAFSVQGLTSGDGECLIWSLSSWLIDAIESGPSIEDCRIQGVSVQC